MKQSLVLSFKFLKIYLRRFCGVFNSFFSLLEEEEEEDCLVILLFVYNLANCTKIILYLPWYDWCFEGFQRTFLNSFLFR